MAKDSKSISIQPIGDRVLVKREDLPMKKSASGIIIPDSVEKEKSKRGVVVAVGTGRITEEGKTVPMSIKVGAKVFFNSGWDNEVNIGTDEEEYFLVKESDILAIVK